MDESGENIGILVKRAGTYHSLHASYTRFQTVFRLAICGASINAQRQLRVPSENDLFPLDFELFQRIARGHNHARGCTLLHGHPVRPCPLKDTVSREPGCLGVWRAHLKVNAGEPITVWATIYLTQP